MPIPVLRVGSKGDLVERWQTFLRGLDLYTGPVDGVFGVSTDAATRALQRRANSEGRDFVVDGIAGNQTIGYAMTLGFEVVEHAAPDDDENGPDWPPPPSDLSAISSADRDRIFGHLAWEPAPVGGNPEAIRITNGFDRDNIVTVGIPQLIRVLGAPKSGRVAVHRLAAAPITAVFAQWEEAGLDTKILAWAGSWAPRLIRGSTTTLSNHAYGTAFDINAPWNALGARPALKPQKGSVRELVRIANEHGWFWGGHFSARKDGMHFELARV